MTDHQLYKGPPITTVDDKFYNINPVLFSEDKLWYELLRVSSDIISS